MKPNLTHTEACRIVRGVGLEITEDNLACTSAGGLLSNGDQAPVSIQALNGYSVEEAAKALSGRVCENCGALATVRGDHKEGGAMALCSWCAAPALRDRELSHVVRLSK